MDSLNQLIIRLRKRSLLLFLLPSIALIGSLFLHNTLINFNFKSNNYEFYKFQNQKFTCNIENNFCRKYGFINISKNKKLNNCSTHNIKFITNYNDQNFLKLENYY